MGLNWIGKKSEALPGSRSDISEPESEIAREKTYRSPAFALASCLVSRPRVVCGMFNDRFSQG